ncbi:MAG: NAD(P)-binding protein [Candidatus Altiarchaeota archaeon]|nr:NAD(P)-binding protein [Candidatus Altiarchaeota archaeon]
MSGRHSFTRRALIVIIVLIGVTGYLVLDDPSSLILFLGGVAVFSYLSNVIIKILRASKMKRIKEKLGKVKGHVIFCGYGDVGVLAAEEMGDAVIIERDKARFNGLINKGFLGVHGDSTNPDTLYEAGIERANTLVIALNLDHEVVYTISTAKELNPGIRVYAKANEKTSVRKMKWVGANHVICLPGASGRELMDALKGVNGISIKFSEI